MDQFEDVSFDEGLQEVRREVWHIFDHNFFLQNNCYIHSEMILIQQQLEVIDLIMIKCILFNEQTIRVNWTN